MDERTSRAKVVRKPCLHDFGSGGPGAPAALIIILFFRSEGLAGAVAFAEHWQPVLPEAAFVGIELDPVADPHLLRRAARDAATARAMDATQIILFGAGAAGRLGVNLILQGLLPGGGVIGLDISAEPEEPHIEASAAMVRLIQHCNDDDPRAARFKAL